MQDTRQQILELLKRHGEVTVQDLSQKLKLTSVTVRHHLEILRSEGYITDPEVRRSSRPGRPRYVYRLTSTAADLFPNNYSGLASALLDSIHECVDPEDQAEIIERTAARMAARTDELPRDRDERMHSTVNFLNQHGFVARWEKDEEGRYLIYVSSCPYHHVRQEHHETCMIDRHLIHLISGGKANHIQVGAYQGSICIYEITWDEDM